MVDTPDPQPQNVTQTTKREIPAELKPYILGGGAGGEGFLPRALQASEKGLAPLPGADTRLEPFNSQQNAAFNAFTNRGTSGDPNTNAASAFLTSALGEDPSTNPQVRAQIAQGQGHLVDQFNLNVAPALYEASRGSGSFGNSSLATIGQSERFNLARALGEVETNTIANERSRQAQIAGLAPALSGARANDLSNLLNVGSAIQGQGQAGRDINFQNFLDERTGNLRNIDILGAALNTAGGGFTNSSTTGQQFLQPGPNPFLQAIGAGGSALGGLGLLGKALFPAGLSSQRKLKRNIRPADGFLDALEKLPIYFWSYKGQTERHVGPMAEDWKEIMGVGDGKTLNAFDMLSVILGSIKELAHG